MFHRLVLLSDGKVRKNTMDEEDLRRGGRRREREKGRGREKY